MPQVLTHLGWTGGAVQADDFNPEGLKRRERGTDLGPQQHGAIRFDSDLNPHGNISSRIHDGSTCTDDCGLGLQKILSRLNEY